MLATFALFRLIALSEVPLTSEAVSPCQREHLDPVAVFSEPKWLIREPFALSFPMQVRSSKFDLMSLGCSCRFLKGSYDEEHDSAGDALC